MSIRYFIGDPCYVVQDGLLQEFYSNFCDDIQTGDTMSFEYKGHACFVSRTAHGDGIYDSNNGYKYGVDSGTICAIPLVPELVRTPFFEESWSPIKGNWIGRVVNQQIDRIEYDEGTISFPHIGEEIYTGG